jgi:hypothetical protein
MSRGAVVPVLREAAASVPQRLLWMIDRHRSQEGCLNYPLQLRITGPLDRNRLAAALSTVVERHEALRTTYERRAGRLLQLIHAPAPVELIDGGRAGSEAELIARVDAEIATPIDARVDVLRATLWSVSDDDHLLCVNVHHLSTDAWSARIVTDELTALLSGTDLPRAGWQFRHVLEWQRRQVDADRRARDYWTEQLAGAVPLPLRPPADGSAPHAHATLPVRLPETAVATLRSVAQEHRTTLFVVLATAFMSVLGREFGVDDVSIASPFANRLRPDVMGTVGMLVNFVVLRHRGSAPTIPDMSRLLDEAREHQHFPYAVLPGHSGPGRLEDVVFQLLPPLPPPVPCGDLSVQVQAPRVASRFPLELSLIASDSGDLSGYLQYAPDRLDSASAHRIVSALQSHRVPTG